MLGGWLIQTFSWRWIFFLNVPLAVATVLIAFVHVPETSDAQAQSRLDFPGATTATGGLGLLVFGLISAETRGLGDGLVLLTLAGGIAALVAFVIIEARVGLPMMPLSLFASRTFSGANLLTFLLYGALGGALYFLPFNLQQVHGYSPAEAGAVFLPFTVLMFSLSRWAGGLVTRYGSKLPLVVGPAIAALGFALFARRASTMPCRGRRDSLPSRSSASLWSASSMLPSPRISRRHTFRLPCSRPSPRNRASLLPSRFPRIPRQQFMRS